MKTHLKYNGLTRTETDQSVIDNLKRKGWAEYTPEPPPAPPPPTQAQLIAFTKSEAGRRILDAYPDWKQRNMTARALELTRKGSLTSQDQSEIDAIQSAWDAVTTLRAFSDAVEADISGGAITTYDEITNANWPAL